MKNVLCWCKTSEIYQFLEVVILGLTEGLLWNRNKKMTHEMAEHLSCDSIMSDSMKHIMQLPHKSFTIAWNFK